jgi:hypothetical protein
MTKKWIAINLLLFVITGLLGWRLYLSILRFDVDNDLAKIQPVRDMKQKIVPETVLPKLPPNKNYFPAEFAIVPEKNIFSESRSREEKAEVAAQPETPPLTQKPILVGINIADAQQTALIIDPTGSAQDRNHRAQTKRVGDVYRGFTITRIASDHIVLESGAQKEIIPLHEGSKKNQGGKTPILSTRVVSFGGGNASGGTPVVSSSGNAPSAARTAVAPIAAPAGAPGGPPVASRQTTPASAQTQPTAPSAQAPVQIQTQQEPSPGSSAPKTRVIRTPFGDIVRPVRD